MLLFWKKFIHHITYSNLLIALCAGSISYLSLLLFGQQENTWSIIVLVVSATQFSYLFHRVIDHIYDGNPLRTDQDKWLHENSTLVKLILLLNFSLAFWSIYSIGLLIFPILFFVVISALWYVLRFQAATFFKPLRKIPYLKAFVIAINWGLFTVILPIKAVQAIDVQHLYFALAIALFVFGQAIPFDLRDLEVDRLTGLKTIAQKIGFSGIKLSSCLAYSLALSCILAIDHISMVDAISIGVALLLSYFIILSLKQKQAYWKYSMLLDSSLSFPFLTYYFGIFLFP